ncbi:MAG: hydroxyacylglutathione hydrolase [Pseudomonadaceae bacterium]|nr:hydroxyacylglutathione hydrolase [Pseudomonadaceae bacterium]
MTIEVHQFPCLSDNYGFLVRDDATGAVATIDTPDADAVNAALEERGWSLTHIFNTHHHFDHAGGNEALKARWGCQIVGAANDAGRIPGIDKGVHDGDRVSLGDSEAVVFEVPGHTVGHIAFYFASDGVAFVGDTLFALGCGRLFEGTPEQMWSSLGKLLALPDDTIVYCAHEYTQANANFALSVDPDNEALVARASDIARLRADGLPTVPTSMALEKATNPFLRPASVTLRQSLNMSAATDVEVFAETRRRKDNF